MLRSILKHQFLIEESEHCIEQASHSERRSERLIARRILENEKQHRSWQTSHCRLMKFVAGPSTFDAQFHNLRHTAIDLINRQALFQYLTDNLIPVQRRRVLVKAFHPHAGYSDTVIAEHGEFLKAASSTICATHLAENIWNDDAFEQDLAEYADAYSSYFCVYCDWVLAEAEHRESSTKPLLLFLKKEAMALRSALLATNSGADTAAAEDRITSSWFH